MLNLSTLLTIWSRYKINQQLSKLFNFQTEKGRLEASKSRGKLLLLIPVLNKRISYVLPKYI